MFLKRIELKGFKSFANKTVVSFGDELIAIVGPNGSGKSNINDAIKWVLGETSKKTLRASKSTDMIFSGAEGVDEADFAEVTLYFNNEKKILDLNFSEVAITKRSYRDENDSDQYFINKSLVRKKDVTNLFLDTGLGNTSLSIISQSSVSKITEAKPLEVREILNEAAGVSKYQQQKEESLRKLEKVRQQLEIFTVKLEDFEKQIGPLKKQKEKAEKYLMLKDELRLIELPIIKMELDKNIQIQNDLTTKVEISNRVKDETDKLNGELREKMKLLQNNLFKLEQEVSGLQDKQIQLSSSIREKTSNNLVESINQTVISLSEIKKIIEDSDKEIIEMQMQITSIDDTRYNDLKQQEQIVYLLTKLEYELKKQQGRDNLPFGVSKILENKNIFQGNIKGLVSDLIIPKKGFEIAYAISLQGAANNIIVEDQETLREAIYFLKENKFGTATFMPADKSVPKIISQEVISIISSIEGFEGILSDCVKTNSSYKNVSLALMGNVLVFDNLDNALNGAKVLNYKFKITTLDGDIIYPGFTVRGGYNKAKDSKDIELQKKISDLRERDDELKGRISDRTDELRSTKDREAILNSKKTSAIERKSFYDIELSKLLEQYKNETGSAFNVEGIDLNLYEDMSIEKLTLLLKERQQEKALLLNDLARLQQEDEEVNKRWRDALETLSSNTISLDQAVKIIDNNVMILNKEYQMTLESLEKVGPLPESISYEEAAIKRSELRNEIVNLGFINLDSIDDYNKYSKDYEELLENTNDLSETRDKLLSTIGKTDSIMQEKFMETFNSTTKQFGSIFQTLFRGGMAHLKLEDPDDLLNTGVLIEVAPPGKTVKHMNLFSGGEKTLTALSLIFAINEVRGLPLLIMDEPEAALDEANVERFARYAKKLNETSQVIVTTHRPGTMEVADILYGVTMQQKGITKIVSVKLEDAIEMVD